MNKEIQLIGDEVQRVVALAPLSRDMILDKLENTSKDEIIPQLREICDDCGLCPGIFDISFGGAILTKNGFVDGPLLESCQIVGEQLSVPSEGAQISPKIKRY